MCVCIYMYIYFEDKPANLLSLWPIFISPSLGNKTYILYFFWCVCVVVFFLLFFL